LKRNWKEAITKAIFVSFIIPLAFIIYRIIVAPATNPENIEGVRVKADYILMLSQCILGIIAMILPSKFFEKKKIEIPSNIYFLYVLFLYAAIFLGEVRNFYYRIPFWDLILHAFSGAMLGVLGFSIVNLLNKSDRIHVKLSPIFVAIFAFCFAVTLGVIWEVYEYLADGILGLNMQKFALENGTQLVGRRALTNTMGDLMVDGVGAFVMSLIGYISLKYKKGWLEKLLIRIKK